MYLIYCVAANNNESRQFCSRNKLTACLVSGPLCIEFPIVYEWGHKDPIKPIKVSIALHSPFFVDSNPTYCHGNGPSESL